MKMVFSSLVAFIILFSQVTYSRTNGLKQIVEEFHFATTVEWDQRDHSVYQEKMKEMHMKLDAANISHAELLNFLASETKDVAIKKEMQTILTLLTINQISQVEAQRLVDTMIKKNYSQGASWNGSSTTYYVLGGLALAALLTWAILDSIQCEQDPNATKICETTYDCSSQSCGYYEYCSCFN